MIYVGTSGWSFQDWTGTFYPPGTPRGQMLNYYARCFPAVEINSTYYRLPPPRVMAEIEKKTPDGFRFTVKLPGEATHARTKDRELFSAFQRVLQPLQDAGKFHGALAQFPYSFRDSDESRDYLGFLRDAYGSGPLFVEFRHESWARKENFALLEDLHAGFVAVDEPELPGLFPRLVRVTGDIGYVRFHGRNARDWWSGDGQQRYNYLYSEEELRAWCDAIRRLESKSRDTYVFFNNCHGGSAAQNARQLQQLLDPAS